MAGQGSVGFASAICHLTGLAGASRNWHGLWREWEEYRLGEASSWLGR